MDGIRVERVDAAATRPLRQRVLRPHQRVDETALPGDDDPDAGHFAALTADRAVVGVASVRREAAPWSSDRGARDGAGAGDGHGGGDWRLRGMATAAQWRGRGVGALVLAATFDHVRAHGGTLLWCNARIRAVPFYQRAGLRSRGEPWDVPALGRHIVMWGPVDPA